MIKHVKRPSSYDSLGNGWGVERLKGCWLTGVSQCGTGEQGLRIDNSVKMPGIFWLFPCYPTGCGGVQGLREERERERGGGKKESLTFMVVSLLRSRGIPWSLARKKNQLPLFGSSRREHFS